jgi:hypothetical protein
MSTDPALDPGSELAVITYGRGDVFEVHPGWTAVIMGGPTNWSREEHVECTGSLFVDQSYLVTTLQFRVRDPVAVATAGNWSGGRSRYLAGAVPGFVRTGKGVVVTDRPGNCTLSGMGDAVLRYS